MTIPIVMTIDGRQNQTPTALREALVALVTATNPGYTANLPASMIEDIASTDVGALTQVDAGITELINSLTPYGANLFLLNQLAQIYGVVVGAKSNTSVYVVFTGTPGWPVPQGFVVSDGTHQYAVQEGAIIGTAPSGSAVGVTAPVYCLAVTSGIWAVPQGTVTTLVTSVPTNVALTCTNSAVGTPGSAGPTEEDTRTQTLEAGNAIAQGMTTTLKTTLKNVPGVQPNLISVQQSGTNWKVIVGGGDPYAVGYAIFSALFNINNLVGSATTSRNVTVSINDTPDTYTFPYVVPPSQAVTVSALWGIVGNTTTQTVSVTDAAVLALVQQPLVNYINGLIVGQPINTFELDNVFQTAVASVIPLQLLTRLVWTVMINGATVAPATGTGVIAGDSESYFFTTLAQVTAARG